MIKHYIRKKPSLSQFRILYFTDNGRAKTVAIPNIHRFKWFAAISVAVLGLSVAGVSVFTGWSLQSATNSIQLHKLANQALEHTQTIDSLQNDYTEIQEANLSLQQQLVAYQTQLTDENQLKKQINKIYSLLQFPLPFNIEKPVENHELQTVSFDTNNSVLHVNIDGLQSEIYDRMFFLEQIPSGFPMTGKAKIVTSSFGWRVHPVRGEKHIHSGIDYGAPKGTTIISAANGIVSEVKRDTYGYGLFVRIRHNFGFTTLYAHLSKAIVKKGDFVSKGQPIALSGNSGTSTGPHLHYEVHYMNKAINPRHFVNWSTTNFASLFENVSVVPWSQMLESVLVTQRNRALIVAEATSEQSL